MIFLNGGVNLNFKSIVSILKNKGYKSTPQREAMIKVLLANHNSILTADELLTLTKQYNDKTNLTTIYRNLEIFEKENLLYKVIHPDGHMAFKLRCTNEHHHHLICTVCGCIEILDFCPMPAITEIAASKSFEITGHIIEVYGICKNCKSS